MILVVGSTGILGSEIVRQLREQNRPVRALVRKTSDPQKVARLKSLGATIIEGDLGDKSSLAAACQGIDTVITTATAVASQIPGDSIPKVDQMGQLHLVEAAMEAGVRQFIYVSFSGNLTTDSPLNTAKRTVEQRLMASGMTYTILRPSYFMEAWLSPFLGFDYPNGQVRIYGDGENAISWISLVDVARFATLAVDTARARNAIIELGGPDKLSPNEVVRIFEQALAKRLQTECVPVQALQAQKAGAQDPLQQTIAALLLDYTKGDTIDMQDTLKAFSAQMTSVKDYAVRLATIPA